MLALARQRLALLVKTEVKLEFVTELMVDQVLQKKPVKAAFLMMQEIEYTSPMVIKYYELLLQLAATLAKIQLAQIFEEF